MPRFYTLEELKDLLEGDLISVEFRAAIKLALEEGTEAAIRSLGYAGRAARPTSDEALAYRQAGE
jgi:hypothetical protein